MSLTQLQRDAGILTRKQEEIIRRTEVSLQHDGE
jgi:hypothetical protein